jgi:hypothetical protein
MPETCALCLTILTGSCSSDVRSMITLRVWLYARCVPDEWRLKLQLTHEFAEGDVAARDEHVQGWRFQLSLFANLIADNVNAGAASLVDQWFAAWSEADAGARDRSLAAIAAPAVRFEDKFSCVDGVSELSGHLAAAQRFMPGLRLERRGDIRHCQWHVLADWVAVGADGQERGRGTNLFVFDAEGRIATVTGFWG